MKYGIYSLLGTLAEFFPEFMVARADRLVQIYVGVLKAEVCILIVGERFLSILIFCHARVLILHDNIIVLLLR